MTELSAAARAKLEKPFALLAESLHAALKGRRMVFMQNDGNFGDSLIRYGTLKFFEDLKLDYTEFDMGRRKDKLACMLTGALDHLVDRYLFVYSGNGAWSTATNSGYRNIRRQKFFTDNLFILPTTFDKHRIDFDFPVFARDRFESFRFLQEKPFCHDMAFYLALVAPERMLPNRTPPTKKTGMMLRVDNESLGHGMRLWPQNYDVSAFGGHRSDPQKFLRIIDQFEHIVTDRLHIAIGGALLNKKVTILAGNYFKIKAIYDSSIKDVFENVHFVETPSDALDREIRDLLEKDSDLAAA